MYLLHLALDWLWDVVERRDVANKALGDVMHQRDLHASALVMRTLVLGREKRKAIALELVNRAAVDFIWQRHAQERHAEHVVCDLSSRQLRNEAQ